MPPTPADSRARRPSGGAPATVVLVDACPYVFRAYFALPDLRAPDGSPIGAVHGFAGFLLRLLAEERPTHLALAFDESLTSSFRNEIDPGYKAGRETPPPELEAQLDACRALGEAFGIATFASERYEADDLIGTLSRRMVAAGQQALVVTNDKDLGQLVDEHVRLYDFARGERYGPAEVAARWGVPPAKIADFLGLAGDAVDSIPGVAGVGARTAAALLVHFADLDDLFARLDEVPSLPLRGAARLAARLREQREAALLSRRLATLVCDLPLDVSPDDLRWHGADRPALEALCARLGMGSLLGRVPRWRGEAESGRR